MSLRKFFSLERCEPVHYFRSFQPWPQWAILVAFVFILLTATAAFVYFT